MACWVKFNNKLLLPVIAQKVSAKGLFMSDGSYYNSGTINYNALRMGFASLNEAEMKEVISIIKNVI
jgi:GntR family transcriptional regulator/MocR family aminotransferase